MNLLPIPPLNEENILPVPVEIENIPIIHINILEGALDLNTDAQEEVLGQPDVYINHSWKNS